MSAQTDLVNLSVGQFADRFRQEMIPISNTFSYFCAAVPLTEEDIKEYLEEPIAALPPKIAAQLPKISIFLVPYLRKDSRERPRDQARDHVTFERPAENKVSWASHTVRGNEAVLVFAVKEQELADYHYRFYHQLAQLMGDHWNEEAQSEYSGLLRDELGSGVHGEVDEDGWRLKQGVLHRAGGVRRDSKAFRDYARQSFIDTLTLFLHGICCDIDVETGPRQLPSRYLRRRLLLLEGLYPPPEGFAVFPEDNRRK